MYDNSHDVDNCDDLCNGVENEVNHAANNEAKRLIKQWIIIIIYAKSKWFVKSETDLLSIWKYY